MKTQQKTAIGRWQAIATAISAFAIFQLPSCSMGDLQQGLVQGVTLSIAGDVFTVAQTVLQNIFRI